MQRGPCLPGAHGLGRSQNGYVDQGQEAEEGRFRASGALAATAPHPAWLRRLQTQELPLSSRRSPSSPGRGEGREEFFLAETPVRRRGEGREKVKGPGVGENEGGQAGDGGGGLWRKKMKGRTQQGTATPQSSEGREFGLRCPSSYFFQSQ